MTTSQSYVINEYFASGKTYSWAQYVDKTENGGNNNGRVDGKEITLFKKIIEHRYNGYQYDFNKLDSEQSEELLSDEYQSGEAEIAKQTYFESNLTTGKGAFFIGWAVSEDLNGITRSYDFVKSAMNKIATFPVESKKYELIKDFLISYHLGDARNGLFEQLGSEYGEGVTNGEAMQMLKAIMDAIPEEKKYSDDYGTIYKIYNEYAAKPADEKFKDSKYSWFSSMFSLNTLDQLDDAVERLFGI